MKKTIEGKLSINKSGYGFFTPDNEEISIFISKTNLNKALDGDRVRVTLLKEAYEDRKAEGKIVEVLERNKSIMVGTFQKFKDYGFVILDDKKYNHDIYIPSKHINKAKEGDKVVVELKSFGKGDKNPVGRIKEILGKAWDTGIDVLSIAKNLDIPDKFSAETLTYAQNLPQELSKADYHDRKDFRDLFTVTIDGRDSKDFDDAISIEMEEGLYALYVHIADVAHYVKVNTDIDRDAYKRGNSVYLLDRVIPMLPEELSNNLCSLNPNEDRLAVTVKMLINERGKVKDYNFYESVIRSDYRLIYEDVSDYLEDENKGLEIRSKKDSVLENRLRLMGDLHYILWEKRERKGSLDFNFKESRIDLDQYGKPIDISIAERRVANKMIESFMVITNEIVGGHFANIEVPLLYRVHDEPAEEKVLEFKRTIGKFGLIIAGKDLYTKDFQNVLKEVEGSDKELLVNNLMLRSMKKAEYRREPGIHFGLGIENYSHFTAPIRRYNDIVVHRILKDSLYSRFKKVRNSYLNRLDEIASHVSETERRAEEAEREVDKLIKCKYMEDKIGNVFRGIISSVTAFGFFVELLNTVEGLVHFRSLTDDFYEFDEENYYIKGQNKGKVFELGQEVRVELESVDIQLREINFKLVNDEK